MGKKSTKIDLTGQTFGRWIVLNEEGRSKDGKVFWRCRCTCPLGTERVIRGSDLRNHKSQSCGCLRRERTSECHTTHGMCKTRLYWTWENMLKRAGIHKDANEAHKRNYADRGITVCEEWLIFENFRDWALSNGYVDDLELDREDNEKGYCPENCRWVSRKENQNNKRNTLRLEDGTSLAMFCTKVGIETCANGKTTKVYNRISKAYSRGKIHPSLIQKANDYLNTLRRLKASLNLLAEVREFAHGLSHTYCKARLDLE